MGSVADVVGVADAVGNASRDDAKRRSTPPQEAQAFSAAVEVPASPDTVGLRGLPDRTGRRAERRACPRWLQAWAPRSWTRSGRVRWRAATRTCSSTRRRRVRDGGRLVNKALVIAHGVDDTGRREILSIDVGEARRGALGPLPRGACRPRPAACSPRFAATSRGSRPARAACGRSATTRSPRDGTARDTRVGSSAETSSFRGERPKRLLSGKAGDSTE
jgi:hypothetical protein